MYITPEQIQAATKANVEAFLAAAGTQYAALEKLATLNASAFKAAFEDASAGARALAGAKDVQELMALQTSIAQPAIEKALSYSKAVYELAASTGAELSKAVEKRGAEISESLVSTLDQAAKNAPVGSDAAVAAVKSMITAANSAYDNLTKAIRQTTELAEANIAAATDTVKGLAKGKKASA